MNIAAERISYKATGFFSKIVTDYIDRAETLKPFFAFDVSIQGIKEAIEARKNFSTNRKLLVAELQNQYAGIRLSSKQQFNLQQLNNSNCFTITTAHQPNIFTGHLYFIYKILHAVKLADHLKALLPENDFVPVYYMGSEDADLEELGEVYINGVTYHWDTKQTGAVGRMKVDEPLLKIVEAIAGQLLVEMQGSGIIGLIKSCYVKGTTIEQATFKLVNALFAEYGLICLLPDSASLKQAMQSIFEDELLNNVSSHIVTKASEDLGKYYKVQAYPREINLFYLEDDKRERIVEEKKFFAVGSQRDPFSKEGILQELKLHPEKFSPNVILRGLFQETILPNIAFIGGGGELAYWLQLKALFEHYKVPYPVQVLRNSFMLLDDVAIELIKKLSLETEDIFKSTNELLAAIVQKHTNHQLNLDKEKLQLQDLYTQLKSIAAAVDPTLTAHTDNLLAKAMKKIEALEKKMLRSEKLKFDAELRQLQKLKNKLFPNNGLQERVENFLPYYAKFGKVFIEQVYRQSLSLEQEFSVIQIN